MYRIFYGNTLIGATELSELAYTNATLDQQINTADRLVFTLLHQNPHINSLAVRGGIVRVEDNKKTIFIGDIVQKEYDFQNNVTVTCQGCLAWLKDGVAVHHNKYATAAAYFADVLDNYNAIASAERKLYFGVSDMAAEVNINHSNSVRTAAYLISHLISDYAGGYIIPRYEGAKVYLDYVSSGRPCNQNIEFAVNLLDLTRSVDGTGIVTRVYPWTKDGLLLDAPYYVADSALEAAHGVIAIDFQSSTAISKGELHTEAEEYLNGLQTGAVNSVDAMALDRSLIDKSIDGLEVCSLVPVISQPHGVDMSLMCISKSISLNNPANTVVNLGRAAVGITDMR